MNRRLIWIAAGVSVLGLGVPAFAAARGGDGTPEDNGVPGDVRGNCDEAEHASDPECLADPASTTIVVTVPATTPVTSVEDDTTTTAASVPETTPVTSVEDDEDDDDTVATLPDTTTATHRRRHQRSVRRGRACRRSSLHRRSAGRQLRPRQHQRRQ